ncbi:MAG: radical SAM protein, partial [Clostridia bacterium]|nr:radical SAM protein [Clostridia bacterium]
MAGVKESSEPLIVRYLHMKAEKNRIPLGVTFELTSRCNFSCRMCYVHSTDCNINKPLELSAGQWIEIAQKAKDAGALFVLITGGEPLVRDDFAEIYEAIAKMGFVISVNTNGSLIDEKILDLFTKNRPNRVNVSLYGADGETYKKLCGVDAYEKVTGNI